MTVKHFGLNRDENGHRKRSLILAPPGCYPSGATAASLDEVYGKQVFFVPINTPILSSNAVKELRDS
jgi:hypothetical protein